MKQQLSVQELLDRIGQLPTEERRRAELALAKKYAPEYLELNNIYLENEPAKRSWRCRLRLHDWSRWSGPLECDLQLSAGTSMRWTQRYQKRECLGCGARQERGLETQ